MSGHESHNGDPIATSSTIAAALSSTVATAFSSTSSAAAAAAAATPAAALSAHHTVTMPMIFFTSTETPLFSASWIPQSLSQYAGSCIFLIVLAFVFRFLLAWKHVLEISWARKYKATRNIIVATSASSSSVVGDDKPMQKGGDDEKPQGWKKAWRATIELPRAGMTVLISGVGYLLMLAVMSLNVGYFMSILAGVFLGELAWGRYTASAEH